MFAVIVHANAQAQPAAAPDRLPARTLAGESCHSVARENAALVTSQPADLDIVCADKAIGRLTYTIIPTSGGESVDAQARLAKAFSGVRPRLMLDTRLDCEAGRLLADSLKPTLAVPCRQKENGWPVLVMATLEGSLLSTVEAPATAYPVMRAMLGSPRAVSQSQLAAEAGSLWARPVAVASAADLEAIKAALGSARTAASQLQHETAEAGFRTALQLQARLFGEQQVATAEILLDLALSVSNQGRVEEAEALLRRAAPIAEQSTRPSDRARLSGYEGYIAANRGDFTAALAFARGAVSAWRGIVGGQGGAGGGASLISQSEPSSADAELAQALNFQAATMLRTDDIDGAFSSAGEALIIIGKVQNAPRWWKSDILLTLGEISSAQGRLSAAETYLKEAQAQRKQIFGEGARTLRARVALGRAYQAEHMNTSAIITFREAIKVARLLPRNAVPFTANDLLPFAAAVVEYAGSVDSASERQGLFAEAFDAFQMIRRPLADRTLAVASAAVAADTPDLSRLIRKLDDAGGDEAAARIRLAQQQSLPVQERSAESEEALAADIATLDRTAKSVREEIARKFPAYAQLAEEKLPVLDALRSRLHDKEGLVTFLIGRDRSFIQLVLRDGVVVAPVPIGAEALTATVRGLRRGLEVQGRSVNEFDLESAHRLYVDLFGGIEKELIGIDRLTIVPSGPLASLPFSLLVTAAPDHGNYRAAAWLVRRKILAYAPSLAAFVNLRSTRLAGNQPRLMLALGNPVLGPAQSGGGQRSAMAAFTGTCLSGGIASPELLRSLSSLPDTASEIRSVAQSLRSSAITLRLGADAGEAGLRQERLDDYRILYFATHGLLPGELRCQSEPALVLTPPAAPALSHEQDGLLASSEIAKLSIKADLVVLSACNTATSAKGFGGESLSGLASAFFHAGARSLVVSHWQVPSAATSRLMSSMFGGMGENPDMPADEALRSAQLRLADSVESSHPFFWAAFVIMGDGTTRPLQTRTGS